MAEYLISCVSKGERNAGGHKHIVSVGVGTSKYTVSKVYEYIDGGTEFRTASPTTGQIVAVGKFNCSCGAHTLRSHADRQWNDNLDNLPKCP